MLSGLAAALGAATLGAQATVPDSLWRAAQAEAPRCQITGIERLGGDTLFVALVDSQLSSVAFDEGEWHLCDGGSRGMTTRDVSRAIVGPLWSAWAPDADPPVAVLEIRSLDPKDAHLRLAFPAPPASRRTQGEGEG